MFGNEWYKLLTVIMNQENSPPFLRMNGVQEKEIGCPADEKANISTEILFLKGESIRGALFWF